MSNFRLQEDKVSTGVGMAGCGLCTGTDEGQHARVERCKKKLQRCVQTMPLPANAIYGAVHKADYNIANRFEQVKHSAS